MSQPATSGTLRRPTASDLPARGIVFRLHPQVRRDVVAAGGMGALVCLVTALMTLQAFPRLHTPASLIGILILEAAGIGAASAWVGWALGMAIRLDAEGLHRFNLLFPERPARTLRWGDLLGAELRPWRLSIRSGYPTRRIVLLLRAGPDRPLPPVDDNRALLDLIRRYVGPTPTPARDGNRT